MPEHTPTAWNDYRTKEEARLAPVLASLGYTLDDVQPHTGGERPYMLPVGSRKLVLFGRTQDGTHIVIKASSEPHAKEEIRHERMCRSVLERIHFAYLTFHAPQEIFWQENRGLAVYITEYIAQDRTFLERPVEEQFSLALDAFKAQESAHATTHSHIALIRSTFGEIDADQYLMRARSYVSDIQELAPAEACDAPLTESLSRLERERDTIEQYCSFLTHWDFTPQNIRIRGGQLYLLDHSSLRFGNKYEGWARFINFMELYHPTLAHALTQYVRDNRAPEESAALQSMRVYRLLELIRHYAVWLPRTDGNLNALARERIRFWGAVLRCVLENTPVPTSVVAAYTAKRDALRSNEEKQRQVGLH